MSIKEIIQKLSLIDNQETEIFVIANDEEPKIIDEIREGFLQEIEDEEYEEVEDIYGEKEKIKEENKAKKVIFFFIK